MDTVDYCSDSAQPSTSRSWPRTPTRSFTSISDSHLSTPRAHRHDEGHSSELALGRDSPCSTPKWSTSELAPAHSASNKLPFSDGTAARRARLPEIDVPLANRFSVSTQNTTTSDYSSATSMYPQSSYQSGSESAASGTASLNTPPFYNELAYRDFEPVLEETDVSSTDDVSYRLRLLVNNNYFLPPAHSKPSPSDLALPSPNLSPSKRGQAPGFFTDMFRRARSRSKSKPSTPTGQSPSQELQPPVLRTTSDSIASPITMSAPQIPPPVPQFPPNAFYDRANRVAVVREQMPDLAKAVQLVEQDMKSKPPAEPVVSHEAAIPYIDPTDVVDVPPPSSDYPFAVQTSAIHGFGVEQSLGADVLADRLLPSQSVLSTPELTMQERAEMEWRRGLLREAVSNSLGGSPSTSPIPPTPTPTEPPTMVSQKIISHPMIESNRPSADSQRRPGSSKRSVPRSHTFDIRSSLHQQRAETPSELHTPLPPPPRKRIINPIFSISQTDVNETHSLVEDLRPGLGSAPPIVVRRSMSSPALARGHDFRTQALTMTPPPLPTQRLSVESRNPSIREPRLSADSRNPSIMEPRLSVESRDTSIREPRISFGGSRSSSFNNDTRPSSAMQHIITPEYTDISRTHSALSVATDYKSAVSARSMATSAFFDARESVDTLPMHRESDESDVVEAVIPPPRTSSQYARIPATQSNVSLARSSISRQAPWPSVSEPRSSDIDERERTMSFESQTPTVQILEPEPTTPPFPLTAIERQERQTRNISSSSTIRPSLDTSVHSVHSLRSAPPVTASPSFFDDIQSQPNAMDDLESSDDEEDNNNGGAQNDDTSSFSSSAFRTANVSRVTVHSNASTSRISSPPSSRRNFMRFGNHSSPHMSRTPYSTDEERVPPIPSLPSTTSLNDRRPVGYTVPSKSSFFRKKKTSTSSASTTSAIQSTYDLYQYTNQLPAPFVADRKAEKDPYDRRWRPLTAPTAAGVAGRTPSMRKLDGLLMQHMESEKDTLKRITHRQVKASRSSASSAPTSYPAAAVSASTHRRPATARH